MKEKYLVSEIAKYFGVTNDTIRYYDKLGIISPSKDKNNNYRYYSRGDIICFSYVFELKNIELPLKEINTMLNDSSLEYAASVIEDHERRIEDKIKKLQQLKSVINDYRKCFNNAIENIDVIKISENPNIIYRQIEEPNGSVIENMSYFQNLTMMHVPLFTFCIDKELFLSEMFYNNIKESRKYYKYALSLKDEEELISKEDFPHKDFNIIKPKKWLTSVVKFYTNKDYSAILKIREYVEQNCIEIDGPVLLRAISFKNNIYNNYDYYEVYIPIK